MVADRQTCMNENNANVQRLNSCWAPGGTSHMQHHMCQGVQDRDQRGERTPRWRGVTLLHELRRQAIPVAIASDNTRDQFFAYGDLDMLEVFNQVPTAPTCPSLPHCPLPAFAARHSSCALHQSSARLVCLSGPNSMTRAQHNPA